MAPNQLPQTCEKCGLVLPAAHEPRRSSVLHQFDVDPEPPPACPADQLERIVRSYVGELDDWDRRFIRQLAMHDDWDLHHYLSLLDRAFAA